MEFELDTLGLGGADVGDDLRHGLVVRESLVVDQVAGRADEPVDASGHAGTGEAEVQTHVDRLVGLPGQVGVGCGGELDAADVSTGGHHAVRHHDVGTRDLAGGVDRQGVGPLGLIAGSTVTDTQFQVGEPALAGFHPGLVRDAPGGGDGREEAPLLVGGEHGRTVAAAGHGEDVALLEGVVDTAELGVLADLRTGGAGVALVVVGADGHVVGDEGIRPEVGGLEDVGTEVGPVGTEAEHGVEAMVAEDLVVGEVAFEGLVDGLLAGYRRHSVGGEVVARDPRDVVVAPAGLGVITADQLEVEVAGDVDGQGRVDEDTVVLVLVRDLQLAGRVGLLAVDGVRIEAELGVDRRGAERREAVGVLHQRSRADTDDGAGAGGLVVGVDVGVVDVEPEVDALADLLVEVDAHGVTGHPGPLEDTVVEVVVVGGEIAGAAGAAAHRDVVLGDVGIVGHVVEPVRVGGSGDLGRREHVGDGVEGGVVVIDVHHAVPVVVDLAVGIGVRRVGHALVDPEVVGLHEGLGVHQLLLVGLRDLEGVGAVISHARPAFLAAPGGDDDDAVGGSGSVDGRRGGILEHVDGDDVGRVDGIERGLIEAGRQGGGAVAGGARDVSGVGGHRHAVDDIERLVVAVGRDGTADVDVDRGARLGGVGRHVEAGDTPEQHVVHAGDGGVVDVFGLDARHGAGQVLDRRAAVADDDDVLEAGGGLGEYDIDRPAGADFLRDGVVADEGEDEGVLCARYREGIASVLVGDHADGVVLDDEDGCSDDGSELVRDSTGHSHVLRKDGGRAEQHQDG